MQKENKFEPVKQIDLARPRLSLLKGFRLTASEIGSLVLVILPFFLFVGFSSTVRENGRVVNATSLNVLAVTGGILALLVLNRGWINLTRYSP